MRHGWAREFLVTLRVFQDLPEELELPMGQVSLLLRITHEMWQQAAWGCMAPVLGCGAPGLGPLLDLELASKGACAPAVTSSEHLVTLPAPLGPGEGLGVDEVGAGLCVAFPGPNPLVECELASEEA